MITIKTKVPKAVYNNRSRKVGDFIIYLAIQSLQEDINGVIARGLYFYKKEETVKNELDEDVTLVTDVVLDTVDTTYSWEQIAGVEAQANLPALSGTSFKTACFDRLKQFTVIQQTMDSGKNYNILASEWDFS